VKSSSSSGKVHREDHQVLKEEEKSELPYDAWFSGTPHIPTFEDAFGLKALAIATYPMYRDSQRS